MHTRGLCVRRKAMRGIKLSGRGVSANEYHIISNIIGSTREMTHDNGSGAPVVQSGVDIG